MFDYPSCPSSFGSYGPGHWSLKLCCKASTAGEEDTQRVEVYGLKYTLKSVDLGIFFWGGDPLTCGVPTYQDHPMGVQ